jgi:protein gp37
VSGHPFESGFDLKLVPEKLDAPLKWRKPRRIFVNSMSDLFHESVPSDYIARIGEIMKAANWHTFQVLTKRADRMHSLLNGRLKRFGSLRNVWWGVSVENRDYGIPRIDVLRRTNAGLRFLSIEPLLEPLGKIDLGASDWVIVGGESGTRPRPLSDDWVREIRDQCKVAGVPFFFKQWGGRSPKRLGRLLDGREWNEIPVRELTYEAALSGNREKEGV